MKRGKRTERLSQLPRWRPKAELHGGARPPTTRHARKYAVAAPHGLERRDVKLRLPTRRASSHGARDIRRRALPVGGDDAAQVDDTRRRHLRRGELHSPRSAAAAELPGGRQHGDAQGMPRAPQAWGVRLPSAGVPLKPHARREGGFAVALDTRPQRSGPTDGRPHRGAVKERMEQRLESANPRCGTRDGAGAARCVAAARRDGKPICLRWPEGDPGGSARKGCVQERPSEGAVVAAAACGVDMAPRRPPPRPAIPTTTCERYCRRCRPWQI